MSGLRGIIVCVFLFFGTNKLILAQSHNASFEFYNKTFNFEVDENILLEDIELNEQAIVDAYQKVDHGYYQPILDSLLKYKESNQLNDWLYYQLVRKTVGSFSPKKDNYELYTFYKWFFLTKSGYDVRLTVADERIVMYVFNSENIADLPYINVDNRKYLCLNYHDYAHTNFNKLENLNMISIEEAKKSFSYKIVKMPDFKLDSYVEKQIGFDYGQRSYHFKIKLNSELDSLFKNYPGVDFDYYFNIPLSRETYSSLIPLLRKNITGMSQKKGIDYLMKFTRYAFIYEDDSKNYGYEKRLSPERTLMSDASDCDDRVALFFCLVKEIYDLPMIVMLYKTHVNVAVQLDKQIGKPIIYNGEQYTICEPTPQLYDQKLGKMSRQYKHQAYEVVYAHNPSSIKQK